ncbi:hypothetical protein EV646_109400 [Kribbella antiqua]|uniref:Uncharacterized protein n=1 Tax=Kribbella antiqua TaxID=2512217 RepID=A0A4R2IR23_9ACTN|nr:hypothetical protein [Kribbella antiqua]TCO45225.1 hypothetical protein EV646_109400 [Kribbella antiqua]
MTSPGTPVSRYGSRFPFVTAGASRTSPVHVSGLAADAAVPLAWSRIHTSRVPVDREVAATPGAARTR